MRPNQRWICHVKKYAFQHNINFIDALKNPDCQRTYVKNPKKRVGIKSLIKERHELVLDYLKKNFTIEFFRDRYSKLTDKIIELYNKKKMYRCYLKHTKEIPRGIHIKFS